MGFSNDLTQSALDNALDPLIGRSDELTAALHILGNRDKNSVVLIGEAGVGKTAIVEGLAVWLTAGNVPASLSDKRILVFDLSRMAAGCARSQLVERMYTVIEEAAQMQNPILFIRELSTLVGQGLGGWLDAINILRPALSQGEIQCITEATAAEYEAAIQKVPWFATCSRTVRVPPLGEADVVKVLQYKKAQYEKFHSVSYTDEALERAARHASGFPGRAIDVLDQAGTIVKLRQAHRPEDLIEVQKRIRFIAHRLETAVANHEFEKARFYSEEEKKERENLRLLREKYRLDEPSSSTVVGPADIDSAIAQIEQSS